MFNLFRKFFKPRLKLARGTRFISFLFIGVSVAIAAGVIWAASTYYNIDTGEVVTENVQRATQMIRATAGLIVGGTASQNPASDYKLEVVGKTKLATTTIGTGQLEFTGSDTYAGFQAPASYGTSTPMIYKLPKHGTNSPAADYILTWQSGDQLTWKAVTSVGGAGDITAVGDVASGDAFTSSTSAAGSSLWFHDGSYTGKLTVANLTGNAVYTLQNATGTVALQSTSTLATGGVLFADNNGLINQNTADLFWDNTTNRLGIGTNSPAYPLDVNGAVRSGRNGTAGQLIISNTSGYGLIFQATSSMAATDTYTWPTDTGTSNYVLTTDGSGNLTWQSVSGVGGVDGSGTANYLAKWTSGSTIATSSVVDNYTGGVALTIATTSGNIIIANALTVNGAGGITSPLYTSIATTNIESGTGDIILNPASGKITLGSNDYIKTANGYEIGKSGTEVLKEMIPILGFDLPVRCSTACQTATTVSRTIENYPFSSAAAGTSRVHKFVIRYADSTTTASSTWTLWDVTSATTVDTFQVPASASTDLAKGGAYITPAVSLPTTSTDAWNLRVQVPTNDTIQIYQIFLAAYDQIQ